VVAAWWPGEWAMDMMDTMDTMDRMDAEQVLLGVPFLRST
jgi:hypothetical protein